MTRLEMAVPQTPAPNQKPALEISVLVVDDEPLARSVLKQHLRGDRDVVHVAEAGGGQAAIDYIRKHHPDLVFLDIRMPEIDGFGVLHALTPEEMPVVIFVTAYDEFAIAAFEAHAIDYVLKPMDEARFAQAMAWAKRWLQRESQAELHTGMQKMLREADTALKNRIVIRSEGKVMLLAKDEVEWIEADGNYLKFHTRQGAHIMRQTMKEFENSPQSANFVRIHRSTMINLSQLRELRPFYTGEYIVFLRSGKELTLSRKYRDAVLTMLEKRK